MKRCKYDGIFYVQIPLGKSVGKLVLFFAVKRSDLVIALMKSNFRNAIV